MEVMAYPTIYVASLGDYNCGRLHGVRIELDVHTLSLDDVRHEIFSMLAESPSVALGEIDAVEEYAVHDAEGFGAYNVGEFDGVDTLYRFAELMADKGDAFPAWVEHRGDLGEAEETWEDAYRGTADSVTDWAYQDFAEMYPEFAKAADEHDFLDFDPDAYVQGCEADGYVFLDLENGETAIFCE